MVIFPKGYFWDGVVLKGSNFRDRMFIKLQKNRKLIKEAAKAKDWPKTKDGDKSDCDPENEVGENARIKMRGYIFVYFRNSHYTQTI